MKCLRKHKKKPHLALRLPSYTPFNLLLRIGIISLVAVGMLNLIVFIVGGGEHPSQRAASFYYLVIIIAFNITAEFQILLDNVLERFLPVPKKIKLRIFTQVILGLLVLFLTFKIILGIFEPELADEKSRIGVTMGMLIGLLFVQMTANMLTVARLTQKWMDQQEEIAEMKREKIRMDYNSLQDQLNPHFLFNNLSVLKSLIVYEQDAALEFTENFTDVYRYVLQSKDKMLVKLTDEIEFIRAYIGLHKERLGDGLQVDFSILKEDFNKEVAPLTLQLLVENAIKHNIASRENPLEIKLETKDGFLCVCNTLQPRATSYSTKTGLGNLAKRYQMLNAPDIEINKGEYRFEVKVPLL